jgi:hypothetical protein
MAAFRYVLSCGTDRRFRGTYCLLLMESVRNNLQLNQLLSSIKSSWASNLKSDAETGLTSRYLAIILMVVYSTRRLLTKSVSHQRQLIDKLICTAIVCIGLSLSSNLLLGIDWSWPKLSSACPYSNLPSLTNWSGQYSALSDPLLDIPTILTYLLIAWCRQWAPLKRRSVSAGYTVQRSKGLTISTETVSLYMFKILRLPQFEIYRTFLKRRSSPESQEGLAVSEFCI